MEQSSHSDDSAQLPYSQEVVQTFASLNAIPCWDAMTWAHHAATHLDDPIKDCVHFEFLQKDKLQELFIRDQEFTGKYFWDQTAQLLIFITRTTPRAILRLIDGIILSVSQRNELLLALALRAWQEQVSVLTHVTQGLERHQARLESIWNAPEEGVPSPTEDDRKLRSLLIGYSLGRRVDSNNTPAPSLDATKAEWKKFRTSIVVNKSNELWAGQLLDGIDEVDGLPDAHCWRGVYEELCEYCHPNSASRTLEFFQSSRCAGSHILHLGDANFSPAFKRVFGFGKIVVYFGCHLLQKSFETLSSSLRPMPPIPDSMQNPAINSIAAFDVFGRKIHAALDRTDLILAPAQLTPEQLARIAKLAGSLRDTDGRPPEQWGADIARDLDPESELQILERCAAIFNEELGARAGLDANGRKLLWVAIVMSTQHGSIGELLSAQPQLKGLRRLDRLFDRVRSDGMRDL